MNTNRRTQARFIKLLTGLFLIISVSSCFSPHYRRDKSYETPEKFEPVPVERANGIYALSRYSTSSDHTEIELEAEPAITLKDIKEIQKTVRYFGTWPEIELQFNEEGSRKLFLLTKANIGKPIAIVIENQIVAMPMVMAGVSDGRFNIAGGFPEDEIDRIIEILKKE